MFIYTISDILGLIALAVVFIIFAGVIIQMWRDGK